MTKYFIIYNNSEVIWCYEEEAYEKLSIGWTLHDIAYNERDADKLAEKACYL